MLLLYLFRKVPYHIASLFKEPKWDRTFWGSILVVMDELVRGIMRGIYRIGQAWEKRNGIVGFALMGWSQARSSAA